MKRLSAIAALTTLATAAQAHPGEHHHIGTLESVMDHITQSPFHMAIVGAGVLLAAAAIVTLVKVRRQK